MNKKEIFELLGDVAHWLKVLGLKGVEKEIVESRSAIEIEHYHDAITFSVKKTSEFVEKLESLQEQIRKEIQEEKLKEIL